MDKGDGPCRGGAYPPLNRCNAWVCWDNLRGEVMTLSLSIIDGLTKILCKFFFLLLYSLFLFLSCERRSFRFTLHKCGSEARPKARLKVLASWMLQVGQQVCLMKVVCFFFDLGASAKDRAEDRRLYSVTVGAVEFIKLRIYKAPPLALPTLRPVDVRIYIV